MKFKVKVTLHAKRTYNVEVEADSWRKAEDKALDKANEEFQADASHVADTEIEVEQQTKDCAECGREFHLHTEDRSFEESEAWYEDDDYCRDCGNKITEQEKANA